MARKPAKKSRKRTTSKARKPHAKPSPEYKVTGPYSPEQRTAIVERMKARHSPVTIQGTIERPDFHVTTDIRATSDPLWRHLAAFRRRLMDGGTFTPAEWQSLLIDIRTEAHAAGLRPHLGKVDYIVATLSEAREGDPGGAWDDEPDNWSKVILTACGEAGWIQLHDLLDGFADTGIPFDRHKRTGAIEWAESWMNARERQLCGVRNESYTEARVVPRANGAARGDGDDPKPPALPAGAEAIDEYDAALLAFLNRNPSLRRKVSDVLPAKGPQDRKAVAKRLRKLADRTPALVDYPKDGRQGVAILPAGAEALKRTTAPTPR